MVSRFGSVRSRSSSGSTIASKRSHDTGLVGLRYEKTVQAEPPTAGPYMVRRTSSTRIPVPIHSPSTSVSPGSPRSPASPPSPSPRVHNPVVVAPPQSPLLGQIVAPPTEQHPALRPSPVILTKSSHEAWKRDSCHAPTATSTTIQEEECDEDGSVWLPSHDGATIRTGSISSSVLRVRQFSVDHSVTSNISRSDSPFEASVCGTSVVGTSVDMCSPVLSNVNTVTTTTSSRRLSRQISTAPAIRKRRNLFKRFSVRSTMSSKPTLINGGSASQDTAGPMETPGRVASNPHPAPANKQPHQSPSSAVLPSSVIFDRNFRFQPLGVSISSQDFIDDEFMNKISFSHRGSIMFGGRRGAAAFGLDGAADVNTARTPITPAVDSPAPASTSTATTALSSLNQQESSVAMTAVERSDSENTATPAAALPPMPQSPPDIRVLTADAEKESQKVRSLYGVGDTISWDEGSRHSYCEPLSPTPEVPTEEDGVDSFPSDPPAPAWAIPRSGSSFSQRPETSKRESELAGGLEDWEDIDGANVDRYGFITVPRTRVHTPTELKSAQFSPRRRNVLHKRDPMGFTSSPLNMRRPPSRKQSARSLNTQNSEMSAASMRSSRSVIRQAGNLLPHNRDRRWMDEAGEMLTVAPNLQDAAEENEVRRISEALKHKEWERSEKWRKMAKVVRKGGQGEGMEFEFDTKNPKLIERTWKGIPDRWRASAWWSFLSVSASYHPDVVASEETIISSFYLMLEQGSPDDVQIDLDVPRTISRHIMFRRRYRGGQRLLFRVLHALSIYFPETGYVQGMASLAATLLCYFDEEKCFVMLVRMWQLRGLDRLYRPGFEGLMAALKEFEESWLHKEVMKKLTELGIDITAYGTRWYLTLFNLSIPFPAQLRVWDVFMLLGDTAFQPSNSASKEEATTGLDILHSTSAALIQALREVLLGADFENAMKALTSWIPIKDEDLLMKVAKAEWKSHQSKKK